MKTRLALFEHAADCPACRRLAAGYQTLHRAILAWGKAPGHRAGMADRILAAARAPLQPSRPTAENHALAISKRRLIAAAASILAVITFGVILRG